jgi:hypothetical protein
VRKLDNWLESYMKYNSDSEAPDAFLFWSGMWVLSAAIGRKAWLRFSRYTVFSNQFIVLVGPPGTFKSTTCDNAVELIEGIEGINLGPDMSSVEALISGFPRCQDTFMYRGTEHTHQSMAITVPEWTTLIGEKEKRTCDVLCRLADCARKYGKWTKTQGTDLLHNYYMTQIAGSAQELIITHLPSSAIGGGLTSRILFIVADEDLDKLFPMAKPSVEVYTLGNSLRDDAELISNEIVGDFTVDTSGQVWYNSWYRAHKKKEIKRIIESKNFDYYYNRKPQFILRTAMLLSVSEGNSMVITSKHLESSLDLIDRLEYRMPEAISGFGSSVSAPVIDAIFDIFRKAKKKKLSLEYVGARLWQTAGDRELKEALRTMKTYNMGTLITEGDTHYIIIGDRKGGKK